MGRAQAAPLLLPFALGRGNSGVLGRPCGLVWRQSAPEGLRDFLRRVQPVGLCGCRCNGIHDPSVAGPLLQRTPAAG